MDYQREGDEEDGCFAQRGVEGECDDEGQRAIGEKEDGCDAEDDEVGNVVGIPERLLVAGGIACVEDGEQKRPEKPPVADGESRRGTDGPEAEGADRTRLRRMQASLAADMGSGCGTFAP